MRKIVSGIEARELLLVGAEKLATIVGATMGPMGRNCVIDFAPWQMHYPVSSRDGVTVAKSVFLEDPVEDCGSRMVREASDKAVSDAGDGTTAATVLAAAIYKHGLEALKSGESVVQVRDAIERDTKLACELIDKRSRKLSGKMIDQVATISANNDPILGGLIAEATRQAGPNGIVAVEESPTADTVIERIEGMQFNQGFINPVFVNQPLTQTVEFLNPLILLLDRPLSSMQGFTPLMEQVVKTGRPLLILAEDVTGEALAILGANKLRGTMSVCPVKLPSNMGHRKDLLKDIAALTDGTAVLQELGMDVSQITLKQLGRARKVVITSNFTRIMDGAGTPEAIEKRVTEIKGLMGQNPTNLERERLQERLAKLTGGVTLLKLGAYSGVELGDKKGRCEDACFSCRHAMQEGVVIGGGFCLFLVAEELPEGIVKKAITRPAEQILENAALDPVEILKEVKKRGQGYNSLTNEYVDLVADGVIDPTRVVKSSLRNASSVARTMLLTDHVIQEVS